MTHSIERKAINMLPNNVSQVTLNHPSLGKSPAGFDRISVEVLPREIGRIVGYDPRTLIMKPGRTKRTTGSPVPHNVSAAIVALQNQVQRSIDHKRVAIMVAYLAAAMDGGTFADWGPIELVTSSRPDLDELDIHHVVRMDADADYFIADGQHRYCAVLDFCREHPQYCERFTQSLTISILPEGKLAQWAGQSFHDRNYYAVAVRAGKALAVDSRDPVNALTKQLATLPVIEACGGIAYERDTLLKGDTRFTTHSVLHRFVKGFLFGRSGIDKSSENYPEPQADDVANLTNWLGTLATLLPWEGQPAERDQYLTRASVVLTALSVVGGELYRSGLPVETLASHVAILGRLDWRRTNLLWVGIVGSERPGKEGEPPVVQPASSRPAIDATIRHFREILKLTEGLKDEQNGHE